MRRGNDNISSMNRRGFIQKAAIGVSALGAGEAKAAPPKRHWDLTADVVVVGAGAAGLPASIAAAEQSATVIVVEQNYDIGGHAMESGGNIALGSGTSLQKKYGIADSPDL